MNFYKKIMFTILFLIIFIFVVVACAVDPDTNSRETNQNPMQEETPNNNMIQDINYQPEAGDVVAYAINKENFQEFLNKPSLAVLSSRCTDFYVFNKSTILEDGVQLKRFRRDSVNVYEVSDDTRYYVGNGWRVDTEFINFMNDTENFKQILTDRNVDDEILNCVFILHTYLEFKEGDTIAPGTSPGKCIWIHTDNGDYFLEYNAYLLSGDMPNTTFTYDFYELSAYRTVWGK